MQLLAAVFRIRALLRLGLFFLLDTARARVGLGLLQAFLFLCRVNSSLFSHLACLFLGFLALFFFALSSLLLCKFGRFPGSLGAFTFGLFGRNPLFFLATLGVERLLLFFCLLLEHVALDVGPLTTYLDIDRT